MLSLSNGTNCKAGWKDWVQRRTRGKGDELVAALGGKAEAVSLEAVSSGEVTGDVLMNSTSIGMGDTEGQSPVSKQALAQYQLVFDAIYTPLRTQLIQVLCSAPNLTTYHERK